MRTSAELREGFLSFFEEKGHTRLPSWPLVPRAGDHSTLLTTAGMQPQMPYFLGREEPPALLTATSQKCFRTPDIDEVGRDGHHLTFFEMLGNFSFGQYFKQGAIELAREFVVERLQLDWDRVWATVHAGDPVFKLGPDEVAIAEWEAIGMPAERIVPLPSSENFWSVGGPGPCGPDSEIYWDWGAEHGCGEPDCAPACPRCDRFLEFWNLVFMEYEQHPDGTLTPLPKQNIDTGLGLERIAAIVQDVPSRSVYETDGYQAIMAWVAAESGVAYGDDEAATKAHRVLADHGRGMTFLVGDGVTPSNEGRGYVLRRIIRRAVQQARTIGLDDLWRLSDVVVEQMGAWFSELPEQRERIKDVLRAEEERFTETLARGMKLFEEVAAGGAISGKDAFDLTATYGFPFELTSELAAERGLAVDEDDFRERMDQHREISRSGGGRAVAALGGAPSEFVGYDQTEVLTAIVALNALDDGRFEAKLERTPFYAAGGGQVTDTGWIEHDESGARAELREAHRLGDDQVLVFEGAGFTAGDRVKAVVPWAVRFPTMANHTATHLLHESLRRVLGEHVSQAGSAVRPDKLRFDFTHERAAHRGGAHRGRAARERAGLCRAPRAHVRDADRRGAQARCADALRREVRRHRPRRRDRRLLARALRRHARPLVGRDRAVRNPLRGLGRVGSTADRGRHLRRGVRAPARARARGRRAARGARKSAQAGEEGRRQGPTRPTSPSRARPRPETSPSSSSTCAAATRSTSPTG